MKNKSSIDTNDQTQSKATLPYQPSKNRFYGIWNNGYTGKKFRVLRRARAYADEHGGIVRRFGYDTDGNMVQMKKPQVITEKAEQ